MKYYPVVKKWKVIKAAIQNENIQNILVRDFNKYTYGRWRVKFEHGGLPVQHESCDWRFQRKGRHPEFWNYVKHGACHWLVNFNLAIAMTVEPDKNWQILTSQKHSTVWDGEETIFDFNFLALGVDPNEAFKLANKRTLKVGKKLTVYHCAHYKS